MERAQCVEQQSELDGHLAELREELRKQQRRINDIELAQTRTRRLADRKEQMNGMHGKPLSNDALAIAEQESSQLVKELEEDIVAATLIDQVNGGNSTPAATALQQVGNTSVSVIEQIERVLSEERSTK